MSLISNELLQILSSDAFKCIVNNEAIKIVQLQSAIALLIKANIPFELLFASGTRSSSPQAALAIYINPSTQIEFTITFADVF